MDTDDPMPSSLKLLPVDVERTPEDAIAALALCLNLDLDLAKFVYGEMVKGLTCSVLHGSQLRSLVAMLLLRALGQNIGSQHDVWKAFGSLCTRRAPAND